MVRIAITPDQVRGVANQFKQKSQESLNMASQLDSAVKNIQ
ncbi:MAG: WXG100 family type VII secretion target, partial [Actinobacteria bacterium]|nr:WXG100 family type VII secretion target [Actinomycetota bacterium]